MKDEEIISLLRSGERKRAFTELYGYFEKVKHHIVTRGGDDADAKDVFQESLIVFYEKALDPTFVLTSTINTYLFSVSKYLWIHELRKRGKMAEKVDVNTVADPNLSVVEEYMDEDVRFGYLEKILSNLGERCFQVLTLFYFNKYSMEEIAESMGYSSVNAVKTQKYKCMERAKKMAKGMSLAD